ncbi:hypothetical protein F5X98DRAFT_379969 [Xylaria grammica]|nr:hypothetical protein F5X98DRAFT_379969 [Xylaria grammica]
MATDNNEEAIYHCAARLPILPEILTPNGFENDTREAHVPESINFLSRPSLRPLTVLDLPYELLGLIFEYVRIGADGPPIRYEPNLYHDFWKRRPGQLRDIQNVRLTCRQFCNSSSHLLINYVQVGLQSGSLNRLKEIASHPLIRRGVRVVNVSLKFYHSKLASSFEEFSAACFRELYNDMRAGRENTYTLEQATTVKVAWEKACFGTNVDEPPQFQSCLEALQAGHAVHQKRYEDQRVLLTNKLFVQGITTALAQMPATKALIFNDYLIHYSPGQSRKDWRHFVSNPTKLAIHYSRPFGTLHSNIHYLDSELPINIIPEVLGALPALKVTLEHLYINIDGVYNTHLLVQDSQTCENLRLLAKKLSYINVAIRRRDEYNLSPDHISAGMAADMAANIYQFLSVMLDTESLKAISLLLYEPHSWKPTFPSIGPVLNSLKRPKLKYLGLHHISIHAHELELFVGSLMPALHSNTDEEPVCIEFNASYLLSGSSADVDASMSAKPYIDWKRVTEPYQG